MDMLIAMGRNEITYNQWMACVDDGGCGGYEPKGTVLWTTPDREVLEVPNVGKHPLTDVSYLDAVSYADWLNEKVGADVYRIPTEAEWELAARWDGAAPRAKYPWGNSLPVPPRTGNYADAEAVYLTQSVIPDYVDGFRTTSPVGSFAANALGLHGVHFRSTDQAQRDLRTLLNGQ